MAKFFSRDVRVFFDGYDPSPQTVRYDLGIEQGALEVTAFGDAGERVIAGVKTATFEWAALFDDVSTALDAANTLIGNGTARVLMVLIGTGTGARAFAGTAFMLAQKEEAHISELVRMEAAFRSDQAWDVAVHYGPKAVLPPGTNSGSIDNTAASTAGGTVYFIIHSATTATGTALLQDSADGITFATLGTALIVYSGTGPISTVGTYAGTIRRYTRVLNVAGSTGTITITAALKRS